jgi:type IV pilus assembly protein PilE
VWNKGFTLLELLIVLALVSILSAVGYTSYQSLILKARRIDAQTTLLNYHTHLQKCFIGNHDFEACAIELNLLMPQNSLERFYQVQVLNINNTTFILQATAQNSQQEDEHCWKFTLDQALQRLAYDTQGNKNADCW